MLDIDEVEHGGKRPGAGRKPLGDEPMTPFSVRCTHAERVAWEKAAKVKGKPLSEWIRENLNKAAK